MMWCTLALTVSLVIFGLSWLNMRQTTENLRDAERLIAKIRDELDRR